MKDLAWLDQNSFALITFRAHESEPQVFEDFINLLLPHISLKFSFNIYTVECDETPSRHIHIIVQRDPNQDKQKIETRIKAKYCKDFFKSLKNKQTKAEHAFDIKLVKNTIEDKMKTIGYIFKDITRRKSTADLSQDLITQSVDFYYADRRTKNAVNNDWKIITARNFHINLEHYADNNNKTVHDYDLVARMTHDRHSFQISAKDQEKYIAELRFANKKYETISDEFRTINSFQENYDDSDYTLDNPGINGTTELQQLRERLKKQNTEIKELKNKIYLLEKGKPKDWNKKKWPEY